MRTWRIGYRLLLGLLLACAWTTARAATPDPWVVVIGNAQSQGAAAVATDTHGNVYVTGTFRGTVDFDPGPGEVTLTSDQATASYIAKYNTGGDLVWVRPLQGDDDVRAYDIVVDHAGYIGVTGSFEGTADLDPGPGVAQFESEGSEDIFLVRVDPNGNLDWGYSAGDSNSDVSYAIAVDAFNDLYITGSFEGDIQFGPQAAMFLSAEDEDDAFVARFTSFGRMEWIRQYGGDGDEEGRDVGVDARRMVYIVGVFDDEIDLDAGHTDDERRSQGKEDMFLVILEEGGNHRGAFQIGGRESERMPQILVEADGSFYLTGDFGDSVNFDPASDAGLATSRGESDFFLAKYAPNRQLIWLYTNGAGRTDTSEGISRDILGNVYITGAFEETIDFDPTDDEAILTALGQDDIYVASFRPNGSLRTVHALRGAADEEPRGLAVDALGNVFVAGDFQGTLDLGNGLTAVADSTPGAYDSFVAKLSAADWLPDLTSLYMPNVPTFGLPTR